MHLSPFIIVSLVFGCVSLGFTLGFLAMAFIAAGGPKLTSDAP
jgi:hypothetical protein